MANLPQPPQAPNAGPKPKVPELTVTKPKFQPPRMIFIAEPGFGKTTFGAFAPKPAIVMDKDETGYETLKGMGTVPVNPSVVIDNWDELLLFLRNINQSEETPEYKTLVFDALGGFEKMCQQKVLQRDYKDRKHFEAFQQGYNTTANEWRKFIHEINQLFNKGIMVILLCHNQISSQKNLLAEDFDKATSDIHKKVWSETKKWADVILYGHFLSVVTYDKDGKRKPAGGKERIVFTSNSDAFEAKNRYGLPERIQLPQDHTKTFSSIWEEIQKKIQENKNNKQ